MGRVFPDDIYDTGEVVAAADIVAAPEPSLSHEEQLQLRITELETENARLLVELQQLQERVQSKTDANIDMLLTDDEVDQLKTDNETLRKQLLITERLNIDNAPYRGLPPSSENYSLYQDGETPEVGDRVIVVVPTGNSSITVGWTYTVDSVLSTVSPKLISLAVGPALTQSVMPIYCRLLERTAPG